MKQKAILFGVLVFSMFFIFQSCRKDNLMETEVAREYNFEDLRNYDRFAPNLEKAIDRALKNESFKNVLLLMTQEKRQGDHEILLSEFLNKKSNRGQTIKGLFLEEASDLIDKRTLDDFLNNYPSVVIATRGNLIAWAKGEYRAPAVVVPSNFDEKSLEIEGHKDGKPILISLDKPSFEQAVVVVHFSERHDRDGKVMTSRNLAEGASARSNQPSIGMEENASLLNCNPEPTFCTDPVINDFEVKIVNGGIRLDYDISNFPSSLCSWGRVRIVRTGPDEDGDGTPDVHVFNRRANQFHIFYDVTALPNAEYHYELTARISYIGATDWVTCHADEVLEQTITAPDILPRLYTFLGTNHSSSQLRYNWYPPSGQPVSQYRLRQLTDNGYEEIPGSPINAGSDNFLFYSHDPSLRGNKLEMQVQYRTSSGIWGGDYFDRTYASYRDPNQPLYWYGVHMPNLGDYELDFSGEGALYGAPEIRLFAIRGAGSPEDSKAIVIQHRVIFTKPICNEVERIWIRPNPWFGGIYVEISRTGSGDYYADVSGNPVTILHAWDNYITGTAVKVVLTETDAPEVIIDDWSTQSTTSVELTADVGYKAILDIDSMVVSPDSTAYDTSAFTASIGVESTWKSSETITYQYPSADIEMTTVDIRYHHPFLITKDKNLFGYNYTGNDNSGHEVTCELLKEHLE